MNSIALNGTKIRGSFVLKEETTLLDKIVSYISEIATDMGPGVLAMNNTYYRPAK